MASSQRSIIIFYVLLLLCFCWCSIVCSAWKDMGVVVFNVDKKTEHENSYKYTMYVKDKNGKVYFPLITLPYGYALGYKFTKKMLENEATVYAITSTGSSLIQFIRPNENQVTGDGEWIYMHYIHPVSTETRVYRDNILLPRIIRAERPDPEHTSFTVKRQAGENSGKFSVILMDKYGEIVHDLTKSSPARYDLAMQKEMMLELVCEEANQPDPKRVNIFLDDALMNMASHKTHDLSIKTTKDLLESSASVLRNAKGTKIEATVSETKIRLEGFKYSIQPDTQNIQTKLPFIYKDNHEGFLVQEIDPYVFPASITYPAKIDSKLVTDGEVTESVFCNLASLEMPRHWAFQVEAVRVIKWYIDGRYHIQTLTQNHNRTCLIADEEERKQLRRAIFSVEDKNKQFRNFDAFYGDDIQRVTKDNKYSFKLHVTGGVNLLKDYKKRDGRSNIAPFINIKQINDKIDFQIHIKVEIWPKQEDNGFTAVGLFSQRDKVLKFLNWTKNVKGRKVFEYFDLFEDLDTQQVIFLVLIWEDNKMFGTEIPLNHNSRLLAEGRVFFYRLKDSSAETIELTVLKRRPYRKGHGEQAGLVVEETQELPLCQLGDDDAAIVKHHINENATERGVQINRERTHNDKRNGVEHHIRPSLPIYNGNHRGQQHRVRAHLNRSP